MKLDIMYCSFDFVRAIGRCHSCMDFLWIALFDSISYLLQSRNVHLRISEIFSFDVRTSLNFRYIHFLCGTMPMCEYERIREGNIRLADGEYFWNIFLRSDQSTLTTFIASKCSYTAVELNLYMVEGEVVCEISIQLKWQKKSEYSHWCPLYD